MSQWICPNCEYVYDEEKGNPREGWPPGTLFGDIDADWTCPDCGVREQVDFLPIEEFEHNDQDGNIIAAETRTEVQRKSAERQDAATEDVASEGEGQ